MMLMTHKKDIKEKDTSKNFSKVKENNLILQKKLILQRGKNYINFTFQEQSVQNGNGKKVEDQKPAA